MIPGEKEVCNFPDLAFAWDGEAGKSHKRGLRHKQGPRSGVGLMPPAAPRSQTRKAACRVRAMPGSPGPARLPPLFRAGVACEAWVVGALAERVGRWTS